MNFIRIRGARENNLRNVNLDLPRGKFIVISGVSGSGKSSLVFDTLFAEGQRRYIEALSPYARQIIGKLDKPEVDKISGLSPAIAVKQNSVHHNSRSTLGTYTDILDHIRLLYSRVGKPRCLSCSHVIKNFSIDEIVNEILSFGNNTKVILLSPITSRVKQDQQKILAAMKKLGFVRVRIDGDIMRLENIHEINTKKQHSIEIVVDRLTINPEVRTRLVDSVETAIKISNGRVYLLTESLRNDNRNRNKSNEKVEKPTNYSSQIIKYSQGFSCPNCDMIFPKLESGLFSFNSTTGACPECYGSGVTYKFDIDLVIPDKHLNFNQGLVKPLELTSHKSKPVLKALGKKFSFSLDTPFIEFSDYQKNVIMDGVKTLIDVEGETINGKKKYKKFKFSGILEYLKQQYRENPSKIYRQQYRKFMKKKVCRSCSGSRLRPEATSVFLTNGDLTSSIDKIVRMNIKESYKFFDTLSLSDTDKQIALEIINEIKDRLSCLIDIGLDYLSLNRMLHTLSSGEMQRVRFISQINSALAGVLYIFDEPTKGLHHYNKLFLLNFLYRLRDMGNTVVVVEHDEELLRHADHIVDLGPGSGILGGSVIASGNLKDIIKEDTSLTGKYLSGENFIKPPTKRRIGNGEVLFLKSVKCNNLRGVNLKIPLGMLVVVTGVSGSGKSTLLMEVLFPTIYSLIKNNKLAKPVCEKMSGADQINSVINIDQSPISQTNRSNPATYIGVMRDIRELFASVPEARINGYAAGRFSLNTKGGRCEHCQGNGNIKIRMQFLSDVFVTCKVCNGTRFNQSTLEIFYKGKNIDDVLNLTVKEAVSFFRTIPKINNKLDVLNKMGLNYVKLGQALPTLSGGEVQRLKMSLELVKRSNGNTIYLLDEPTTGLHFDDIKKLLLIINEIVEKGETVVIAEHHLEVIKQADWIIDLGPGGGDMGGEIVDSGTPEMVAKNSLSFTGEMLCENLSTSTG